MAQNRQQNLPRPPVDMNFKAPRSQTITYRGNVYRQGDSVIDKQSGEVVELTNINPDDRIVWVKSADGQTYTLGISHIRKTAPEPDSAIVPGTKGRTVTPARRVKREEPEPDSMVPVASGTSAIVPAQAQVPAQAPTVIDGEILPDLAEREQRLADLEAEISDGLAQIDHHKRRVWLAAATIRAEELWLLPLESGKVKYKSFVDYCSDRWGWERSYAHENAKAGEVISQLKQSGIPDSQLPTATSQVTELAKLSAERRPVVLRKAIDHLARLNKPLTAQAIREAAHIPEEPTPGYRDFILFDQPYPCWFQTRTEMTEGQAIAYNLAGYVRVCYGEDREADMREERLSWSPPGSPPVPPPWSPVPIPGAPPPQAPEQEPPAPMPPPRPRPMPEATLRLKLSAKLLTWLEKNGGMEAAIVQLRDGTTYCIEPTEIRLEEMKA